MSRSSEPREPMILWPIYDRALLSRLVEQAVKDTYGSQQKAARQTKVSQTLLSRIIQQKITEIHLGNFIELLALFSEDEYDELYRAVMPPTAQLLREQHNNWVDRSLEQASADLVPRAVRTKDGFELRYDTVDANDHTARDRERQELWEYVCEKSPWLHRKAEALFKQVKDVRYRRLALSRMLDPLLNASESGYVQVSWREFTGKRYRKLESIVRLGLQREEILLPRQSRYERVHQIIHMPSTEFIERFGREAITIDV